MFNPFVDLLADALWLYMWCVIIWTVLVTLVSFKVVNAYQPVVRKAMYALNRLCEPVLRPIQKMLPDLGGLDISPVILLLLLNFARRALYSYFYNL